MQLQLTSYIVTYFHLATLDTKENFKKDQNYFLFQLSN